MDAPNCFLLSKRIALLIVLLSLTHTFGKTSPSLSGLHRGGGEGWTFLSKTTTVADQDAMASPEGGAGLGGVAIVFSDLDGTLIHYPDNIDELISNDEENRRLVKLPASSTGMGTFASCILCSLQLLRSTSKAIDRLTQSLMCSIIFSSTSSTTTTTTTPGNTNNSRRHLN